MHKTYFENTFGIFNTLDFILLVDSDCCVLFFGHREI